MTFVYISIIIAFFSDHGAHAQRLVLALTRLVRPPRVWETVTM